jgi:hypothetical protein
MKQEVITITDCGVCPHRYAKTGEYPSDTCSVSGRRLGQMTAPPYKRFMVPPDHCPLRTKDHMVNINRCYTLGGKQ